MKILNSTKRTLEMCNGTAGRQLSLPLSSLPLIVVTLKHAGVAWTMAMVQ